MSQCWPADASLTSFADFDTMLRNGGAGDGYPADHCKYCFYRGQAQPGEDASHWWYGTGNGAHDVPTCPRLKRFIAEGGDPRDAPKISARLAAGGLRFRKDYAEKHKPGGEGGH